MQLLNAMALILDISEALNAYSYYNSVFLLISFTLMNKNTLCTFIEEQRYSYRIVIGQHYFSTIT